jgi:hypothetical protein
LAVYPRTKHPFSIDLVRAEYTKAVRSGVDPAVINDGAKRYGEKVKGKDNQYTKSPINWLREQLWTAYAKPRAAQASKLRVFLPVNSEGWKAWDSYYKATGRIRAPEHDLRPAGDHTPIVRGWYFDSEFPPDPDGLVFVPAATLQYEAWTAWCRRMREENRGEGNSWGTECYVGGTKKEGFWFGAEWPPALPETPAPAAPAPAQPKLAERLSFAVTRNLDRLAEIIDCGVETSKSPHIGMFLETGLLKRDGERLSVTDAGIEAYDYYLQHTKEKKAALAELLKRMEEQPPAAKAA